MWKCKHCGEDVEDSLVCWNCGYSREGTPPPDPEVFAETKEEAVDLGIGEEDETQHEPDLRGPISMAQAAWAESVIGKLGDQDSKPPARYPAVPFVAGLLRVLAWVVAFLTGVSAIVTLLWMGDRYITSSDVLPLLWLLTSGTVGFAVLLALSEGLRILCDTEENTRHTAMSQYGKDQES